ncbi:hypothetical protein DIPPA_10904 [Diplonema papillatum]|nr:hypothetical protein DIPPA_10904 [Diplonema papillatum]
MSDNPEEMREVRIEEGETSPVSTRSAAAAEDVKDGMAWEYYVYHPYARILVAAGISGLNFLMYAEDPVAHSYAEAELPVIGHAYNLLFTHYPNDARTVLKIAMTILFFCLGVIFGRLVVHHMILRDFLALEMFGYAEIDPDDTKPVTCYNPCNRNTPYNQFFWWQTTDDKKEEHGDVAIETGSLRDDAPAEKGWRTREEYQALEETAVEVICPRICHPKKHKGHTKGSWIATLFTTIVFMFIGALLYNAFIGAEEGLELDGGLQTRNRIFMKVAAVGTWLGDFFTAVMVLDGMLQEVGRHQESVAELVDEPGRGATAEAIASVVNEFKYYLPATVQRMRTGLDMRVASAVASPARRLKMGHVTWWPAVAKRWNGALSPGKSSVTLRVVVVWALFLTSTIVVLSGILLDFIKWDKWTRGLTATTEVTRTLLAAVITMLDLIIVMQDWEFPGFDSAQEVKFPGIELSELSCGNCCSCQLDQHDRSGAPLNGTGGSRKLPMFTAFATGRWFNYGIIFLVMCLDFNMLKNQLIYSPPEFGQYVNPEHNQVCVVRDYDIANAIVADYKLTSSEIYLNGTFYDARVAQGHLIPGTYDGLDFCMPSRYSGSSNGAKYSAALPSFTALALFFFWLYRYNRIDRIIMGKERKRRSLLRSISSKISALKPKE